MISAMSGGLWREWTLVLLAAAGCSGENSQLSGPVSGYVFDGARREVRPILGIPGASTIGGGATRRSWLSAFKAGVYWGWLFAPRGTRRDFVRFGDPPFGAACSPRAPARSGWLPGTAVTSGLFRLSRIAPPVYSSEPEQLPGFHCRPDCGRPSHEVWSRRRIGVRGRSLQNRRPGSR